VGSGVPRPPHPCSRRPCAELATRRKLSPPGSPGALVRPLNACTALAPGIARRSADRLIKTKWMSTPPTALLLERRQNLRLVRQTWMRSPIALAAYTAPCGRQMPQRLHGAARFDQRELWEMENVWELPFASASAPASYTA
jgi:hypothetical protein